MDTIFALATARGKAGVAIIRISGPSARLAVQHLCGSVPPVRVASLRTLKSAQHGVIDEALVLVFDEGHSFTGEHTVEFQLHGSTAIVATVLAELGELPNFRIAEPGEFTRRALENDRLDLTQVEGLADLIEAETEAQRKQAQRVLSGALGQKVEEWRRKLVRAAALLEATIDFADEDVPVDVTPEVLLLIEEVLGSLQEEVRGALVAERIRDGFEVAIIGSPNVGKSTLLNALAGREAAITSEIAGTTRDVIEVRMDIGGFPVTLLDTAGLRETEDAVESLGIERARSRAVEADLCIQLVDSIEALNSAPKSERVITLLGKGDLFGSPEHSVSGISRTGIDSLVDRIRILVEGMVGTVGTATRERHRIALSRGVESLTEARDRVRGGNTIVEFAAEDLRRVVRDLEVITGRVDVESLLDVIFASFCLGK